MKIQPVKGTRDFYPEEMAKRNFITDLWKQISLRNGFLEYDGPIFEYLKMYQQKSGDEIASQLFSFEDRGKRQLAIRPEITPTLARMVNQRINALAKPIKWFSVPRLCRAERPQKGRLREFFQWNVDIIGIQDCLADAEIIFTSVDFLLQCGLNRKDFTVRISSRTLIAAMLEHFGLAKEKFNPVYAVLDKKSKIPKEAFDQMLQDVIADDTIREKVGQLMAAKSIEQLTDFAGDNEKANEAVDELKKLFGYLEAMGIADTCCFDITIVRGLAYYTGIVFEIYDSASQLRALCGGGRYDNLLADFGGPKITATGMGMGDCVLSIMLEEKKIFEKNLLNSIDYFVAVTDKSLKENAVELAAKLRRAGFKTELSYKITSLGKQLKQADSLKAAKSIILGSEYIESKELVIKNMADGSQSNVKADKFCQQLG